MKNEAGGMSSRHGGSRDSQRARLAAIEVLIERGKLVREGPRLILRGKDARGKSSGDEVTVHGTKALLLHKNRRTTNPISLLKIPRES